MSEKRKGGRVKATWRAGIRKVFRQLRYTYEGSTLVGTTPVVTVVLSLEREPDRVVTVDMTAEDARKWARAFDHFAEKIENNDW